MSYKKQWGLFLFFILILNLILGFAYSENSQIEESVTITHGPVLGQIGPDSVGVWIRTSRPVEFSVNSISENSGEEITSSGKTTLEHDKSGWVTVRGLQPGTRYRYSVSVKGNPSTTVEGTFKTIPSAEQARNPDLNPNGLFNFSFEFGACNLQNPSARQKPLMPAYRTMNREIREKVDFHLMLGDFIYEYNAGRNTSVSDWQAAEKVADTEMPKVLGIMDGLAGIWENYKLYYDRSPDLQEWHRNVPSFFMFDDHEILNDINGAGTAGTRDKIALFRDVGIRAWNDYLGWANPVEPRHGGKIHNGKADIVASNAILNDPDADFSRLDNDRINNLHIHWNDDHPSAGVYEIDRVIDRHRIKLNPEPAGNGENLSYSIGTHQFYSFKVGNAEFFILDTRSMRDRHDKSRPARPDISMLGETQKKWLIEGMKRSDADFLFVASSVSFVIPHVAEDIPEKDESWTVYLHEREELIKFWDQLKQPVLLLTGDLHNAMSIQIEDNIFEFMSGAHNSGNHYLNEEADRPPSGPFTYNERTVNLRWSTFWNRDVPRQKKRKTIYTVVKMNNVFNNPTDDRDPRWAAYPIPQVVVQFYDGATGDLLYAEAIAANK